MTEMMDLYGIGDHGGGPTRAILDEGLHWASGDKVVPKMQFGTAQSYFSTVEKQLAPIFARVGLPEHRQRLSPARRRCRARLPFPPGKTRCISNITAA